MKPHFRWRTEDEVDWLDEGQTAVSNRYGRRSWWLLAFAFAEGSKTK